MLEILFVKVKCTGNSALECRYTFPGKGNLSVKTRVLYLKLRFHTLDLADAGNLLFCPVYTLPLLPSRMAPSPGMERGRGLMGHTGGLIVGEWPLYNILPTLSQSRIHERVKEIS